MREVNQEQTKSICVEEGSCLAGEFWAVEMVWILSQGRNERKYVKVNLKWKNGR